jgi:hypothetical protein
MYVMVGIEMKHFPDMKDDIEFSGKLMAEESV